MVNVRVRNLDLVYNQENNEVTDVNVRFETFNTDVFYLNGSIKITKAEYDSVTNIEALADLVEVKLKEKLV